MPKSNPRIVLIGCARSAGVAIDDLTRSGRYLPENVEWVSMPCGSAIDELQILRAFEAGADRVMVLSCNDGSCRSVNGDQWAEKRVQAARGLLEELGIGGWRIAFHKVAPNMSTDILGWLEAFSQAREEVSAE